jgi:hypothetical protein
MHMKKAIPWIIVIILGIIALWFLLSLLRGSVSALIENQNRIASYAPDAPPTDYYTPPTSVTCDGIRIDSPIVNDIITPPVSIEAVVRPAGNTAQWTVFEGQAGVARIRAGNQIISESVPLMVQGDWMTTDPRNATAVISSFAFNPIIGTPLTLDIIEDDPSGEGNPTTCSVGVTWGGM